MRTRTTPPVMWHIDLIAKVPWYRRLLRYLARH